MAWLKTDQKFLARTPLSALSHENLGSLIPLLSGLKYTYNKLWDEQFVNFVCWKIFHKYDFQ